MLFIEMLSTSFLTYMIGHALNSLKSDNEMKPNAPRTNISQASLWELYTQSLTIKEVVPQRSSTGDQTNPIPHQNPIVQPKQAMGAPRTV